MFVLFPLLIVGLIAAARSTRHRRDATTQRARGVAVANGLQIDVADKPPDRSLGFDLFDKGNRQNVSFQMWRPTTVDSVFQYRYHTGSSDNTNPPRKLTAALVALPFDAPHLTIETETWWTRSQKLVGRRDIEIESDEFNRRYRVRCADERFAVTLLDPHMIAFMLSPSSGLGAVSFEFRGRWALLHGRQVELEQLPAMLHWGTSVRDSLPTVLPDWYPPG